MKTPVFEELDPKSGCDCPGCVQWRRVIPSSSRSGPPSGCRTAARTAFVLAAAGAVLAVGQAVPAVAAVHASHRTGDARGDEAPETPQGRRAPLHGPAGARASAGLPKTTRSEIINRAKKWIAAQVPYSMDDYWTDGYRQDCSGFVSMAWNLGTNEWTGSLDQFGVRISKQELQPGDILLFHNQDNPERGSHVVIFGGWMDYTHMSYVAYEETPPQARRQVTPYAYWSNSERYVPYRYKGVVESKGKGLSATLSGMPAPAGYPSAASFGQGADNGYVDQLGKLLVTRGGSRFYAEGPGTRWSEADEQATRAFQQAQGWAGPGADGLPGPTTWSYLMRNTGQDIPATGSPIGAAQARSGSLPGGVPVAVSAVAREEASGVPGYPGLGVFRPGADNPYVAQLGRQLVQKGFGAYYTRGPGSLWSEEDRRNVEAFQRALGWRGAAADGYPGPETWRRLFS